MSDRTPTHQNVVLADDFTNLYIYHDDLVPNPSIFGLQFLVVCARFWLSVLGIYLLLATNYGCPWTTALVLVVQQHLFVVSDMTSKMNAVQMTKYFVKFWNHNLQQVPDQANHSELVAVVLVPNYT